MVYLELEELLQTRGEATGCDEQTVLPGRIRPYGAAGRQIANRNIVDLGKGFGLFKVKLKTSPLVENSPGCPKRPLQGGIPGGQQHEVEDEGGS